MSHLMNQVDKKKRKYKNQLEKLRKSLKGEIKENSVLSDAALDSFFQTFNIKGSFVPISMFHQSNEDVPENIFDVNEIKKFINFINKNNITGQQLQHIFEFRNPYNNENPINIENAYNFRKLRKVINNFSKVENYRNHEDYNNNYKKKDIEDDFYLLMYHIEIFKLNLKYETVLIEDKPTYEKDTENLPLLSDYNFLEAVSFLNKLNNYEKLNLPKNKKNDINEIIKEMLLDEYKNYYNIKEIIFLDNDKNNFMENGNITIINNEGNKNSFPYEYKSKKIDLIKKKKIKNDEIFDYEDTIKDIIINNSIFKNDNNENEELFLFSGISIDKSRTDSFNNILYSISNKINEHFFKIKFDFENKKTFIDHNNQFLNILKDSYTDIDIVNYIHSKKTKEKEEEEEEEEEEESSLKKE